MNGRKMNLPALVLKGLMEGGDLDLDFVHINLMGCSYYEDSQLEL